MHEFDIIGIGAMNLDHIYMVDQIVLDGETIIKKSISYPGGSAANTIYGLAKLGCRAGFIGAIGPDNIGKQLLDDFAKVGVDTSHIIKKTGASTGTTTCLTDNSGKRSIYLHPGANSNLDITDIDMNYLKKSNFIFLSSFANTQQLYVEKQIVHRLTKQQKIIFSPGSIYANQGWNELYDILKHTHVLFINKQEIQTMTDTDFISGAKKCLESGCNLVVITLGEGLKSDNETFTCFVFDGKSEYRIKAVRDNKQKKHDTIGAGDAFAAGFLFGLLNKKNIEKCGLLGNILANMNISATGARKGLPDYKQLSAAYSLLSGKTI